MEIQGWRRQTRSASPSTPRGGTAPTSTAAGASRLSRYRWITKPPREWPMSTGRPPRLSAVARTIVDVVGDGARAQGLVVGAGAVPAQAQCDRAIARIGEEVQEVLVPAPRAMPAAVNEQQRHRMRVAAGPLVDHLEHEPDPLAAPIRRNISHGDARRRVVCVVYVSRGSAPGSGVSCRVRAPHH